MVKREVLFILGLVSCQALLIHCKNLSESVNESCCEKTRREFHRNWAYQIYKLTDYLERLRNWKCDEFEIECSRKTFDFTEFTSLVYERFCQPDVFNNRSLDISGSSSNPTVLTEHFSPTVLTDPYSQIMQYAPQRPYVEIYSYAVPFSGIIWCGFDEIYYRTLEVSVWSCLHPRDQIGTYVIMVVCGVLAVLIVIANTTVIVVFSRGENKRSIQVIYKMSMAVADLLVGLFVFPASIVTTYLNLFGYRQLIPTTSTTECTLNNFTSHSTASPDTTGSNMTSLMTNRLMGAVPNTYLTAVGCVTALSISVSVYTLMLASYDRFRAVSTPIQHMKNTSVTYSILSACMVWVFDAVLALLPVFTTAVGYSIIAGILVGFIGELALPLYGVVIAFPLFMVWLLIGATWWSAHKQNRQRRQITENTTRNKVREQKMNRVLLMMVVAFSCSLIPVIVSVIVSEMASDIHFSMPLLFSHTSSVVFSSFELLASVILMTNSLWNCLIYSARNDGFKKEAKSLYKSAASAIGLFKIFGICNRCAYDVNKRRRSSAFSVQTTSASDAGRASLP